MDWFKHDVHCLQDDRLFALVSRYGMEGYAIFFHAIEAMYANNGEPLSEISVRRIAFDFGTTIEKVQDVLGYAASESCDFLLMNDGSGFTSERVLEECGKHSEKVSKMQSLANKRWNAERNATRITEGNAKRNADKIREDKNREDCNSSSPLQEESIKNKSNLKHTGTTPIACSEPSEELKLEAENPPSSDPVFLTITTNRKEEFPIHESDVQFWEETYPGVDVRSELRKIKAWSRDNASQRKTAKGMKGFCNRWLSREQDRAGTRQDSTVKGTPVRMSLVADGTREGNKERRPVFK